MPSSDPRKADTARPAAPSPELDMFRTAFEASCLAMLVLRPELDAPGPTVTFANASATALTGYLPAELVGRSIRVLNSPRSDPAEARRRRRSLLRDGHYTGRSVITRKEGAEIAIRWNISAIPGRSGGVIGWLAVGQDDTERRNRPERRPDEDRLRKTLLEGIPHLIWQARDGGNWCAASPQWEAFTGQDEAASIGAGWSELISPPDRPATEQAWQDAVHTGVLTVEHRIRRHDGTYRWFQTRALPVPSDAPPGADRLWVGTSTDIDDLRGAEARLRHIAFHDPLTDLGNRTLLAETLDRITREPDPTPFNLLYLDIDDFTLVNDQLGRRGGDDVLREVARRLTEWVRDTDLVTRVGDDEFVLLQANARAEDGARLAERINRRMPATLTIAGQQFSVAVSIGIASFPADGTDGEELLRRADLATDGARNADTPRIRRFEPTMERARHERLALQLGLAHALDRDEIAVAYQVIRDVGSGVVHGYEALARWTHPDRGAIPPAAFIPIAEESGQIVPIGRFVLERACRDAITHHRFHGCCVSVNLSPAQFRTGTLARTVDDALRATGLPPSRLELEVTERLLMNGDAVDRTLRDLKAIGVRIALDDFGTGFSNLGYLCRFPFDRLKIDQSFVRRMDEDGGARAVVGGIIALAHSLHLCVTAEGVETEDEYELLRGMGCDQVQGYLFGRPVPVADLGISKH